MPAPFLEVWNSQHGHLNPGQWGQYLMALTHQCLHQNLAIMWWHMPLPWNDGEFNIRGCIGGFRDGQLLQTALHWWLQTVSMSCSIIWTCLQRGRQFAPHSHM